jgi:hypothetical protein
MRHFLLTGAVTTLPFGLGVSSATTALIATTCRTHGASAGVLGTAFGAERLPRSQWLQITTAVRHPAHR